MTFHAFFRKRLKFSIPFGHTDTFESFQNFPFLQGTFDLRNSVQQTQTLVFINEMQNSCRSRCLFLVFSRAYLFFITIVLALTSAVTKLPNINLIFSVECSSQVYYGI